jgi:iron(III) transport system permease protein
LTVLQKDDRFHGQTNRRSGAFRTYAAPSKNVNLLQRHKGKLNRLFPAAVSFALALLVVIPMIMLIFSSFRTGRPGMPGGTFSLINYIEAYSSLEIYVTMARSLYFAGVVTVVTLILGGFCAWLVERTNMPGRGFAYSTLLSSMAIPRMLFGISWILLLSPRIGLINYLIENMFGLPRFNVYSMSGMIFIQILSEIPTAFLMMQGTLRGMDPALEEAAFVSRSNTLSTLRKITLPIMTPSVLAAAVYLFIINIEVFEIPGLIGLPAGITLFSTAIYNNATVLVPPNHGLANSYAVAFLLSSVFLIVLYRKTTQHSERYSTITGKGYRPRVIDLGIWRYLAFSVFMIFFITTILLPVLVLIYASLIPFYQMPSGRVFARMSLQNYVAVIQAPWMSKVLKNTLLLMAVAPTVSVLLAALVAWVVHRTRIDKKWKATIDILSFLPTALPSIVIALSLLIIFLNVHFIPLYGTLWIIGLAFLIRYIPYTVRSISAAVIQIHKELEESAQVCRATEIGAFFKITVPLIAPALINAWIWVAMHSCRAVSASLMLYSAQNEILSTRIWLIWRDGKVPMVCALSVMMILFLIIISLTGRKIARAVSRR